jgi:hypothetical protein
MPQKTKMQTYVAFIVPDSRAPHTGIALPFAARSRRLEDLDIPPQACAFYFYDAPAALSPQESLQERSHISREYLLAHEILTRHDIKTLLAGKDYPKLAGRMRWDPRVENNDLFIVTRSNAVQPVTENHIVIDARLRQIHPEGPPDTGRTANCGADHFFTPILRKDVLVPKLGDIRRRPPAP